MSSTMRDSFCVSNTPFSDLSSGISAVSYTHLTSSIDTRTEMLIQEAFDRMMQGRTSFIVAHRLSTIRNADEILVMKDGSIIEQGSHEELMAKGGFYQNLYNSQFVKVSE